jgi:hypothetical protein
MEFIHSVLDMYLLTEAQRDRLIGYLYNQVALRWEDNPFYSIEEIDVDDILCAMTSLGFLCEKGGHDEYD